MVQALLLIPHTRARTHHHPLNRATQKSKGGPLKPEKERQEKGPLLLLPPPVFPPTPFFFRCFSIAITIRKELVSVSVYRRRPLLVLYDYSLPLVVATAFDSLLCLILKPYTSFPCHASATRRKDVGVGIERYMCHRRILLLFYLKPSTP